MCNETLKMHTYFLAQKFIKEWKMYKDLHIGVFIIVLLIIAKTGKALNV